MLQRPYSFLDCDSADDELSSSSRNPFARLDGNSNITDTDLSYRGNQELAAELSAAAFGSRRGHGHTLRLKGRQRTAGNLEASLQQ